MRRVRQRWVRPVSALLLVAALLLPAALRAHRHAEHVAARPCAVCIVAKHSPIAGAEPVRVLAPLLVGRHTVQPTPAEPASRERPPRVGRAPPSSAAVQSA